MSRRAVITGLGPVTALGTGKTKFFAGLREGRSPIARASLFDASPFHAQSVAEIADFDASQYLPTQRTKRLDRYARLAVVSALLALEDAEISFSPAQPNARYGVSFGTALGGICDAENEQTKFLQGGPKAVKQTLALQVFGGSAHCNIAIETGFQGVGTTNSNSCASGTVAVGEALRYIREGRADLVVAGGAEAPLSPLTFGAFDFIKTMSRSPAPFCCRPFDRRRDGFVMGEGAAALIVEELEHARRRGAKIYAEVLGFSHNNDAFHMTTPRPDGIPTTRVMQDALMDSDLEPRQIGYINAHASSTQVNEANEARCLATLFGNEVPISGTKAFTGHPLGATGAIEALICALALDKKWLPPTLHLEEPDPDCHLDLITGKGREQQVDYLLSNSFGFGGINSCLVLGRAPC